MRALISQGFLVAGILWYLVRQYLSPVAQEKWALYPSTFGLLKNYRKLTTIIKYKIYFILEEFETLRCVKLRNKTGHQIMRNGT